MCCIVHVKDVKHTHLYTNYFIVCLILRECRLVDWLVDWWVDGRMTNWTCVCCGASEIYISSFTQNAWPAYNLSFHMNYTGQTAALRIYHYKLKLRVSFKKCRKMEIKYIGKQSYQHSDPANVTLPYFYHKLPCFIEVSTY